MDWSKNPLVAIYFAIKDCFSQNEKLSDSLVYIYTPKAKVNLEHEFNPFKINTVQRYIPKYWNPRIVAQSGVFTVHPKPLVPFKSKNIEIIRIANCIRSDIKIILNRFGINDGTLFPDLDGISNHIKWLRT